MFPIKTLAYVAACIVVVISPGPDNILAIGRGLSQGRLTAALSAFGAGVGIMCHTWPPPSGCRFSFKAHLKRSVVKAVGAMYLIWLGYKALAAGNLISFTPSARLPLRLVWVTGVLSNVLNPKPGLFVLAFSPQSVDVQEPLF